MNLVVCLGLTSSKGRIDHVIGQNPQYYNKKGEYSKDELESGEAREISAQLESSARQVALRPGALAIKRRISARERYQRIYFRGGC